MDNLLPKIGVMIPMAITMSVPESAWCTIVQAGLSAENSVYWFSS